MNTRPRRFFVIGAGRAGTTSICGWLATLPDVAIYNPKEPSFFCRDDAFCKGLKWYESLAPVSSQTVAVGEGSVLYSHRSYCAQTAERISRSYPDARIIYVTRNPLWQVLSNWRYSYLAGYQSLPFTQAIQSDPSYLERCHYDWQLEPYRQAFNSSQIHVAFFEDLLATPNMFLAQLCTFLGITLAHEFPPLERLNSEESVLRPSRFLSGLRKSPVFLRVRQHVPPGVRRAVTRALSARAALTPDCGWTAESHAWFIEKVEKRTHAFLRSHGRSVHYWDLSSSAIQNGQ